MKSKSGVNKTRSVNKTSVNKCNEATAMEGTSVTVVGVEMNPVENGAGVAVASVLLPPSEPPGSLSSGALPEAACFPEPLGPRKVSSGTKRAARFNPMEGMAALSDATVLGTLSKVIAVVFQVFSVAHLPFHRWISQH